MSVFPLQARELEWISERAYSLTASWAGVNLQSRALVEA